MLAIPLVALAWFAMVPSVLTIWTFLTFVAVAVGLAWVANLTWLNLQPTQGVAHVLHDAENPRPAARVRGDA